MIVYTQILCFVRHLEMNSCMLIYADLTCVTSQPGLKVIVRNVNILPAILSRCTVPFTRAQAIAKRILKRRHTFSHSQSRLMRKNKNDATSGLNFASEKASFRQNARVCVHSILAKMHIYPHILLAFWSQ